MISIIPTLRFQSQLFLGGVIKRTMSSNKYSCERFLIEKAFIGGKWQSASDGTFNVTNPANGDVIGKAPNCTKEDCQSAITSANEAFKSWSLTSAKSRSALIRKMFEIQMKYQKELAELITIEMGKPLAESMGEINYGASFFEWFSEEARRINGEIIQSPFPDKMLMYTREPIGVAGIIVPVNLEHLLSNQVN